MESQETLELYKQFVVPNYGRFDLRLARGEGTRVWDEAGNEYLDFGAGIAVCSIGHCHPRVVAALTKQLGTLVHTSNLYYTRPQALLAKRLVGYVGHPGKIFFCNSGAEANEALYKIARKFGNECEPPPPVHTVGEEITTERSRYEIITFDQSFHGRTLAGISATGQDKVKKGFEPMVEGFIQVPYNDTPALLAAITPRTAAILLEPIQGESGIKPADARFLQDVRDICDKHGLLMMLDEVQCGLGRTGDWCGWKTLAGDKLIPDAVSWAKGIAGGFPLGAVWVRDKKVHLKTDCDISLADLLGPGSHGTTFGGTPLVCSGANEVLAVIEEENLLANARTLGAHAKQALQSITSPLIKEVRGVGLMIGIEFVADFSSRIKLQDSRSPSILMVNLLHEARLLTVPSGTHAIRWLPPLNVSRAEIDKAVEILRGALGSVS
ncbi:MAG TPA: aspartate aminotransferase family protein [Chthoniobacteraceae bacterium]|nr:aspartate aminotransferase family protein [Chthoniobacteraceae bacterium]